MPVEHILFQSFSNEGGLNIPEGYDLGVPAQQLDHFCEVVTDI